MTNSPLIPIGPNNWQPTINLPIAEATYRATYENRMRHDDDAKSWFWKQNTTSFDLVNAVSFFLSAGWPTSQLVRFLDTIKPMAGWLDEHPEELSSDDPALTADNHKALRSFFDDARCGAWNE